MAEAWNHAQGRADERIKRDALAIRADCEGSLEKIQTARQPGAVAVSEIKLVPTAPPGGAGSPERANSTLAQP
eukprot:114823-Pyramimonas_sp.AAC.1